MKTRFALPFPGRDQQTEECNQQSGSEAAHSPAGPELRTQKTQVMRPALCPRRESADPEKRNKRELGGVWVCGVHLVKKGLGHQKGRAF